MAETPTSGAPSDFLMALYMGDRERAEMLAGTSVLSLPELAAFGDLSAVSRRLALTPADVMTFSSDGWTALHLAGYFGYDAVTVVLIRAGSSLSVASRNAQGNTPLHAALAGRGSMAVLSALIAAGSDVSALDAQGVAPIHLAASRGDQAATALLMACGADKRTPMPDGKTAADFARERGHADLADWLAGAN